jgi:hypothetical protein
MDIQVLFLWIGGGFKVVEAATTAENGMLNLRIGP